MLSDCLQTTYWGRQTCVGIPSASEYCLLACPVLLIKGCEERQQHFLWQCFFPNALCFVKGASSNTGALFCPVPSCCPYDNVLRFTKEIAILRFEALLALYPCVYIYTYIFTFLPPSLCPVRRISGHCPETVLTSTCILHMPKSTVLYIY